MLHEKKLLEQFMMPDKHPLPASSQMLSQWQTQSSWEYFNIGLGLLSREMELVSYNSSFCNLTALPPESVLKSNLYGILGFKQSAISVVRTMIESDGHWSGKIKLGDRSLRIDLTSLQASDPSIAANPHKPAYSVTLVDYTEEFRQLQLLSEAKFQAEKTDRAKSQFLSHMSHELRTPLNAILGFAQLLGMDETLSDLQMDNVKEIEGAGEYLLSLINEILDLSRIEAGRIELSDDAINLEHLLNECFALVKPLAEQNNVFLEYQMQDACILKNDHVRLKQIVLNLLSNAVKYNQNGGRVVLQCVATDTSMLRIEIVDTGNGINQDQLPYIFTPFERLGADSRHIEGTGIGLMITRRLVKLMKGDIGVVSRTGAGSIFWIDLPVHQQSEGLILSRSENCSTLFNLTHVFGFGPPTSRVFRLLEDLCSIRTSLLFRHEHSSELLLAWMQQHQGGYLVLHASLLPGIDAHGELNTLLNKFTILVVNDSNDLLPAASMLVSSKQYIIEEDCKYADLPVVLFGKPESCKVIKQCN